MNSLFEFFPSLGTPQMLVLLVIGVLLFGRTAGRYLSNGIVEFKNLMKGD